jgi:peptidoglycan-N-acetylglucosamine deacetylase
MGSLGIAIIAILAASGGLVYYACSVPTSQWLGPTLVRGRVQKRRIALTFDDGPAEPFTAEILDVLGRYRVPATFFVCGKNVERFPDLVRRMQAEGHTIGNHTFSHPLLYFQPRARIAGEIDRTQDSIEKVTGARPRFFRPPYGVRWFGLFPLLRQRGMRVVQWSDTGYDWKERYDAAAVARLTLGRLRPGSVILLHDGREPRVLGHVNAQSTVEALPAIIEGARAAGWEFAPLKEFVPD